MADDKVQASYSEIRAIGQLSHNGVFLYDHAARRFTYVNSVLVKTIEINHKLLMEDPEVLLHAIPRVDQEYLSLRFAELMEQGSCEGVHIRISNSRAEKVLLVNAYLLSDNPVIVGFVSDMTKEKEHEEYLINFGAKKDAILDMVCQNLSTPLNLSNFTVDLIERAVHEKKYHKIETHIKLMREVTSDCIRIIDDFLQEEHLQSPNIDPKVNRFDIVARTLIVLDKLKLANPDKQIRLTTQVKHLVISGDDLKYFQIVHNLLSNAIKFTKPNGLIELMIIEHSKKVELKVRDDGIGIPADLKPFIFDKKTRASRPGLKGEVSNGIGLYVVRMLTTLMKGTISCDSQENKGTTFTLQLPKFLR